MKKASTYSILLILSILSILLLSSCSKDDNEFSITNIKGKPSRLFFKNKTDGETNLSYLYEGDNISKIEGNSYYSKFEYKNGELYSIYSGSLDANITDGNSFQIFERDGNKIVIDLWGEPSLYTYRYEIVLDDNNLPTKLNDLGVFSRDEKGDLIQQVGGYYYSIFSYDSSGKKLMKQLVYIKRESRLMYEIDYRYDNNPGLFSKVNLPTWYIAYRAFECKGSLKSGSDIYLNSNNNLLSKKIVVESENINLTINYTLTYDTNNFPTSISSDIADEGDSLTIKY